MPAKTSPRSKARPKPHQEKMDRGAPKDKQAVEEHTPLSVNEVIALAGERDLPFNMNADEIVGPEDSLPAEPEADIEALSLGDTEIAAELAEDPVRLYLREIGQVNLLHSDSEFRLATFIEADRLIGTLRKLKQRKGLTLECSIYHSLLSEMSTSWDRLLEDTHRLEQHPPELALIIAEAQSLHAGWEFSSPSYLRAYLDNGQ